MNETDLPRTVYNPPPAARSWTTAEFAGHKRLRVFSLARWALVEALRLAQAGGRKVLVPEFICREVLASVWKAGAEPAFYPVGPDLELAGDPGALPPAAAILSVNYFGFPQDLSPFQDYARRRGALLIEDNAHGLLSRDRSGRALGTRAPLGLLSMRKTLALPDGGALLVNDEALWPLTSAQLPAAGNPAAGLAFMRRRRAARGLARWLGAPRMVAAIHGARFLRKLRTGARLPASAAGAERLLAPAAEPAAEALLPFLTADLELEARRRRELYALCARLLEPTGIAPVFASLPDGVAPYAYPYRAAGRIAERAEAVLRKNGLFSLPWPELPDAVIARAPQFYMTVHAAHFLW